MICCTLMCVYEGGMFKSNVRPLYRIHFLPVVLFALKSKTCQETKYRKCYQGSSDNHINLKLQLKFSSNIVDEQKNFVKNILTAK